MSVMQAIALPPAALISSTALCTVPGSFGWGSLVLATTAMLAPSCAARSAIDFPIPRLAPVMNSVFPLRLAIFREAPSGADATTVSPARGGVISRRACDDLWSFLVSLWRAPLHHPNRERPRPRLLRRRRLLSRAR